MNDEFLRKASDLGGPLKAHGRARGQRPTATQAEGGLLALTDAGLVFVVEDLFAAGAATLIPLSEVTRANRRDDLWGAELTLETRGGTWHFSRLEPAVADQLMAAAELPGTEQGTSAAQTAPGLGGAMSGFAPHAQPRPLETSPLPIEPAVDRSPPAGAAPFDAARPDAAPFDAARPDAAPPSVAGRPKSPRLALGVLLSVAFLGAAAHFWMGAEPAASEQQVAAVPPMQTAVQTGGEPHEPGREALEIVSPGATPTLHAGKPTYHPQEPIEIHFNGFPGHDQDWVTLVPSGAADNRYDEWHYLRGQQAGTLRFRGLAAGSYEARAYFDWPRGGYMVRKRVRVMVFE